MTDHVWDFTAVRIGTSLKAEFFGCVVEPHNGECRLAVHYRDPTGNWRLALTRQDTDCTDIWKEFLELCLDYSDTN